VSVLESSGDLARHGADFFVKTAKNSVQRKGMFFVALSGGSTPRAMHRLLTQEPRRSNIPWDQTHVFWVDERCVPASDPASNFGAATRDFVDQAPIPPNQVHPMPGEMEPEAGALKYQDDLVHSFQLGEGMLPVFDLIFLGIGTDGHTASLFPGHRALKEGKRMVLAVKGGNPDVNRLTLTLPVINNAREIVFLASGKEKAPVVKAVLNETDETLPALRVKPHKGRLSWLMDKDAASEL
jgi:6-phosphogluconolactonase